jgi:hypothetical protein
MTSSHQPPWFKIRAWTCSWTCARVRPSEAPAQRPAVSSSCRLLDMCCRAGPQVNPHCMQRRHRGAPACSRRMARAAAPHPQRQIEKYRSTRKVKSAARPGEPSTMLGPWPLAEDPTKATHKCTSQQMELVTTSPKNTQGARHTVLKTPTMHSHACSASMFALKHAPSEDGPDTCTGLPRLGRTLGLRAYAGRWAAQLGSHCAKKG